ncbi:MFS transporter [Acetobacteraceae bacterium H6797]|nr:MFS transporter [Acetobacteraceae bacterium H6797]
MAQLPAALLPLRHADFRLLWIANLASNTGMWVQNTGAGWLMTNLAPEAFMVGLVQAASMLPVFLLGIPAGALADILDRRLYLISAQLWMVVVSALLALMTTTGLIGPWVLLAFTFFIGAGSAANYPAWGAVTPEIVPRRDLAQAIVLNGIGFNLTRAVGPALGGFVIGWAGTGAAFIFNAACASVLLAALIAWRREAPPSTMPKEHFLSAMRAGVRYAVASPLLRTVMFRSICFFFFGAAMWSLLPLVVRQRLGLGPEAFGMMLGAMGAGAVLAGLMLPPVRERLGRSNTVLAGSLIGSASLAILGFSTHWLPAAIGMMGYGASWITTASTLQASAQMAAPSWVRARAVALYNLAFFGALTAGAGLAGWIAEYAGVGQTLVGAGAAGAVVAFAVMRWKIEEQTEPASASSETLPNPEAPAPEIASLLTESSGRVLETMRYSVAPTDRAQFLLVMAEVRRVRMRAGALSWRLYEDVAHPERWVELWVLESWTEHLRETARLEPEDRATLLRAAKLGGAEGVEAPSRYLRVDPS